MGVMPVWYQKKPKDPKEGDAYYDVDLEESYIYLSGNWVIFSSNNKTPKNKTPLEQKIKNFDY